jgi:hypothetical protein
MVLWGMVVGAAAVIILLALTPTVWPTEDDRGGRLRASMAVLEHGGPLLTGRHGPRGSYYAVDYGDDEGEFVYIPLLSRLLGVADPVSMLRDLYIALVALSIVLYPSIFYRLSRSWLAGLAAPLMLLVCILSLGFIDIYWIPAWGALTLLPLIFLLARHWPRYGLVAIAGISLAASWLSSIRSYSGFGIAVAGAIVLLLQRWRWWRLLPALAMVAVIYISINTFVFSAIRADRAHRLGSVARTLDLTSAHTLWHSIYAGFGYLPNSYGMRFLDTVPRERVEREAPGTPFLSSRYEAIIRRAYSRLIADHPGEALRQYAGKALVVVADSTPYLLLMLLTLPAALLLGPDARMIRRWCLLAIPPLIVGCLPVVLALPRQAYEEGLYGVIGTIDIVGLCWALGRLQGAASTPQGLRRALARATPSWRSFARSRTPGWRSARLSLAAILVLIAVAVGGAAVRGEADRWQHDPSGVLMEHLAI